MVTPIVNVTGSAARAEPGVPRVAPVSAAAAASARATSAGVRCRSWRRLPDPPVAAQETYEHVAHGLHRPDPYHWMRRLDAPVLDHLAREREWYDVATGHLGPLVQELRAEMTDRVPATDSSVSWPQHGYSYRTVLPAGREYEQLLRRRDAAGAEEQDELLLDVNELVGDTDYVELGSVGGLPGHLAAGLLGGLRR